MRANLVSRCRASCCRQRASSVTCNVARRGRVRKTVPAGLLQPTLALRWISAATKVKPPGVLTWTRQPQARLPEEGHGNDDRAAARGCGDRRRGRARRRPHGPRSDEPVVGRLAASGLRCRRVGVPALWRTPSPDRAHRRRPGRSAHPDAPGTADRRAAVGVRPRAALGLGGSITVRPRVRRWPSPSPGHVPALTPEVRLPPFAEAPPTRQSVGRCGFKAVRARPLPVDRGSLAGSGRVSTSAVSRAAAPRGVRASTSPARSSRSDMGQARCPFSR